MLCQMILPNGIEDLPVLPALAARQHQLRCVRVLFPQPGICMHQPHQIFARLQCAEIQKIALRQVMRRFYAGDLCIGRRRKAFCVNAAGHDPHLFCEFRVVFCDLPPRKFAVGHDAVCPLHGTLQPRFQQHPRPGAHRFRICMQHHVMHCHDRFAVYPRRDDIIEKVREIRPVPLKQTVRNRHEICQHPVEQRRKPRRMQRGILPHKRLHAPHLFLR